MADKDFQNSLDHRRKKHKESFSNYENAVTLVSSLESWIEFRWGPQGKERAGLLDYFDRFPEVDGLTPDFEVRFHTPYYLWGDYKRTVQPSDRGRGDVGQIIGYALRRPPPIPQPPVDALSPAPGEAPSEPPPPPPPVFPNYDVVVLVSTENDDIAAEAINLARAGVLSKPVPEGEQAPSVAPVVVLGCHLDRESINGEWYKRKWRDHHENQRFSTPNICDDVELPDLNALLVDATHHSIRVNKSALNLTGRTPFMNDQPPPIYTAIRLVIPAINALLTDDERDKLQSTGRVEKTLCRADILGSAVVTSMQPQPKRLESWVEAALDFMQADLGCARWVPSTNPPQFIVTVHNALLKSDARELWTEKAATKGAKQATKRSGRKRSGGSDSNQPTLWD